MSHLTSSTATRRSPLRPLPSNFPALTPVSSDFFYASSKKPKVSASQPVFSSSAKGKSASQHAEGIERPAKRRRVEVQLEDKSVIKTDVEERTTEEQEMLSKLLAGLDDDFFTSMDHQPSPRKRTPVVLQIPVQVKVEPEAEVDKPLTEETIKQEGLPVKEELDVAKEEPDLAQEMTTLIADLEAQGVEIWDMDLSPSSPPRLPAPPPTDNADIKPKNSESIVSYSLPDFPLALPDPIHDFTDFPFDFDISPSPSPQKPGRPAKVVYPVLNPSIHDEGDEPYEPVPWFRGEVERVWRKIPGSDRGGQRRWGHAEKTVMVKDVKGGGKYELILRDDFASLRIAIGDIVNVISPLIARGTAGPLSQAISGQYLSPTKPSSPELHVDLPARPADPENGLNGSLNKPPQLSANPSNSQDNSPIQIVFSLAHPTTYLILHPDHLLPPTSLSSSLSCSRRPLLTQLLRSTSGSTSKPLLYGNIIHEVLQLALQRRVWDRAGLKGILAEVLARGSVELDCWGAGVGGEEVKGEVWDKIELGVLGFGKKWIGGAPKPNAALHESDSTLAISGLHDIEESIWSPKWGMKGKVDASLQVTVTDASSTPLNHLNHTTGKGGRKGQPMPFEIKTGRAVGVMEHRAQTMLYTLLMEDRYQTPIQAGLLYYTQTDSLLRVPAAKAEIRGLLMARNEQATYLSRTRTGGGVAESKTHPFLSSRDDGLATDESMALVDGLLDAVQVVPETAQGVTSGPHAKEGYEEVQVDEIGILPPTVDNPRECRTCYSVNECMLYRRAVDWVEPDVEDPIAHLYETKTGHLTDEDAEFFSKWEQLVSVEEQDMIRFKNQLWTMTAKEREKTGRCFADMVILEHRKEHGASLAKIHQHTYRFTRAAHATSPSKGTFLNGHIGKGDPISLSIEPDLVSIARGFVVDLTPTEVVVGSNAAIDVDALMARTGRHPLASHDLGPMFRIDKDEMMSGTSRMRNNLAHLFYTPDAGGDEKRRRLIVGLEEPTFEPIWAPEDAEIPEHLNIDQRAAMTRVMTAKDYALILGMPGTGKTTAIAEIIKALVERGKSVLLTSYTHSAVDTILMKLINSDYKMLRLGNVDKVHPDVAHLTLDSLPPASTLSELEARMMSPQIVATTCLSIDHPLFKQRKFDFCIVDEASQITLPTCLGPLRFADTFVLVGDHFQLPPIVRNPEARRGGLDVSLFRLLSDTHKASVVDLSYQYRMNEDIMSLSNHLIYGGRLKCGTAEVAKQALQMVRPWRETASALEHPCTDTCWIEDLLEPNVKAVFVDTDRVPARESRVGDLVQNAVEGQLIHQLVSALVSCGIKSEDVAVITPYRQQIKLLTGLLKGQKGVEILTADKSQGRDKDCIIVSMVRSNDVGNIGELLRDWRRINVSFTRAKKKLVIFGSRSTLQTDLLLSEFFDLMQRRGWIQQLKPSAVKSHETMYPSAESPMKGNSGRKVEDGATPKGKGKMGPALLATRPFLKDAFNDITNNGL